MLGPCGRAFGQGTHATQSKPSPDESALANSSVAHIGDDEYEVINKGNKLAMKAGKKSLEVLTVHVLFCLIALFFFFSFFAFVDTPTCDLVPKCVWGDTAPRERVLNLAFFTCF